MDNSEEKITWTQKMIMTVIEEAKERPCLWCRSDTEYSNKIFKSIAYQEIGEIVGVPAENVREKLRNLRINFMQVHKKQMKGDSRGGYPPRWEYYNSLLFMADSIGDSPAPSPFLKSSRAMKRRQDSDEGESTRALKHRRGSDENGITSTIKRRLDIAARGPKKAFNRRLDSDEEDTTTTIKFRQDSDEIMSPKEVKRRLDSDETATSLDPLSDELNKTRVQSTTLNGSNQRFGEFVTASLNSLEDDRLIKRTKAKVQLLISEAITEHAMMKLSECESAAEF